MPGRKQTHFVLATPEGRVLGACGLDASDLPPGRIARWPDDATCFKCRCVLRAQGLIRSNPRFKHVDDEK